ncbi:MAG: hypothetical protein HQL73_05020 [Magnetococcales bacterium]|nr:hypothetical protein [Magnetococcales bacterium]
MFNLLTPLNLFSASSMALFLICQPVCTFADNETQQSKVAQDTAMIQYHKPWTVKSLNARCNAFVESKAEELSSYGWRTTRQECLEENMSRIAWQMMTPEATKKFCNGLRDMHDSASALVENIRSGHWFYRDNGPMHDLFALSEVISITNVYVEAFAEQMEELDAKNRR